MRRSSRVLQNFDPDFPPFANHVKQRESERMKLRKTKTKLLNIDWQEEIKMFVFLVPFFSQRKDLASKLHEILGIINTTEESSCVVLELWRWHTEEHITLRIQNITLNSALLILKSYEAQCGDSCLLLYCLLLWSRLEELVVSREKLWCCFEQVEKPGAPSRDLNKREKNTLLILLNCKLYKHAKYVHDMTRFTTLLHVATALAVITRHCAKKIERIKSELAWRVVSAVTV